MCARLCPSKCAFGTHHDTVGFSDGPEVDLFVIAAGDQDPARLVAQRQTVDIGAVRHELLCGHTGRATRSAVNGCGRDSRQIGQYLAVSIERLRSPALGQSSIMGQKQRSAVCSPRTMLQLLPTLQLNITTHAGARRVNSLSVAMNIKYATGGCRKGYRLPIKCDDELLQDGDALLY